jgi:phospholipid-binding lipoprotein MlaA
MAYRVEAKCTSSVKSLLLVVMCIAGTAGCSSWKSSSAFKLSGVDPSPTQSAAAEQNTIEKDEDLDPLHEADGEAADEERDPLEGFNRAVFTFNDTVDVYLLEPAAKAYDWALPNPVQRGVTNFFENLRTPSYFVSSVVQLDFSQASTELGRFLVNSTVGVAGLIDVGSQLDMKSRRDDFGIALGHHGVPSGPYLVLPLLGASNLRDTFGRAVDFFLDPFFFVPEVVDVGDSDALTAVRGGFTALRVLDQRALLLDAVSAAKEASLDYYLFTRSAYRQLREAKIRKTFRERTTEEDATTVTTEEVEKSNEQTDSK